VVIIRKKQSIHASYSDMVSDMTRKDEPKQVTKRGIYDNWFEYTDGRSGGRG